MNENDQRRNPIQPLSYQTPRGDGGRPPRIGVSTQVLLGFFAWFCNDFIAISSGLSVRSSGPKGPLIILCIGAVAVLIVGVWLRRKFQWTGFLPGLLLGFGLTCLLPAGLFYAVCGK